MKDNHIINIGKSVFGLFFLLGSLFFFGFFITGSTWFMEAWIIIFFYSVFISLLIISGLLVYGAADRRKMNACLKATGLILLNVPLAFLYIILGIQLTFQ